MNKTVASVIDDINEWANPYIPGEFVYYVTAFFTDGEVGSAGRKDMDAALEVQGLLRESIGIEQDFVLEPKKPTKSGKAAWKILGFGTPGGAATYTAPGVQGTAGTSDVARPRSRSPEHDVDASIRAAVALKAAASFLSMSAVGMEKVLEVAEFFEEWLQRKASEPASSAYSNGSGTVTPVGQAGAGSEDRGEEVGEAAVAQALGEGTPASTPLDTYVESFRTDHIHDYQPMPGGFLKCDCGKMRKKETAPKT